MLEGIIFRMRRQLPVEPFPEWSSVGWGVECDALVEGCPTGEAHYEAPLGAKGESGVSGNIVVAARKQRTPANWGGETPLEAPNTTAALTPIRHLPVLSPLRGPAGAKGESGVSGETVRKQRISAKLRRRPPDKPKATLVQSILEQPAVPYDSIDEGCGSNLADVCGA